MKKEKTSKKPAPTSLLGVSHFILILEERTEGKMQVWSSFSKDFFIGQPGLFLVYFPFSHQAESNSDRTDLRRLLYPLDHHHDPSLTILRLH